MADGKENSKWRKLTGNLVISLPDTCISITVSEFEMLHYKQNLIEGLNPNAILMDCAEVYQASLMLAWAFEPFVRPDVEIHFSWKDRMSGYNLNNII